MSNSYSYDVVNTDASGMDTMEISSDRIPKLHKQNRFSRFISFLKKRWLLSLCAAILIVGLLIWILPKKRLTGVFKFTGSKPSDVEYYNKIRAHQDKENPFWHFQYDNLKPTDAGKFILDERRVSEDDIVPNLCLRGLLHSSRHFNLLIRDCDNTRFEIPYEFPFPFANSTEGSLIEDAEFDFQFNQNPLEVIITRKDTGEVAWAFALGVYTKNYIEFNITLSTKEVYGLGERTSPLQYKPGIYTLFTLDRAGAIDYGIPGFNGQGHQPVYLSKEKSGKYHMVYFRNSNFQEVIIREENIITWQAIGGIIDLNLFLGDENPETVVRDFNVYSGGWAMPAFWHLGYQVNKWKGYMNVSQLAEVVDGMNEAKCPLDAIWSDVDYFENQVSFKYDESRFPIDEMRNLFKRTGKRWLAIADPYLSTDSPVEDFVNPNSDYSPFLILDDEALCPGKYIGNIVYTLDYVSNITKAIWHHSLAKLESKVHYSGLWLDASEISSIAVNKLDHYPQYSKYKKYDDVPFKPGGGVSFYDLYMVSPDCVHSNGIEEFDFRPFSSLLQAQMTFEFLKVNQKTPLPFILIRANTVGGGKFGFHFLPDVFSTWETLRTSMGPLLTYPMFGFTMMGVDVGGFIGIPQTAPELIIRWHQVAVFYPYSRNSKMPTNELYNNQEPYVYAEPTRTALIDTIYLRYKLLRWFYSLFVEKRPTRQEAEQYQVEDRGVGTVVRPIFFKFFNEKNMPPYGSVVYEQQFVVGNAVMAAPVFYPLTSVVKAFFPKGEYVDLRYHTLLHFENAMYYPVSARIDEDVPYFLLSGYFIYFNHFEDPKNSGKRRFIGTTEDIDDEFDVEVLFNSKFKSQSQFLNVKNQDVDATYNTCILKNCLVNATFELQNSSSQDTKGLQMQLSLKSESSPINWNIQILLRKVYLHSAALDVKLSQVKLGVQGNTQSNLADKYNNLAFSKVNDSLLITFSPPIAISDLASTQVLFLTE